MRIFSGPYFPVFGLNTEQKKLHIWTFLVQSLFAFCSSHFLFFWEAGTKFNQLNSNLSKIKHIFWCLNVLVCWCAANQFSKITGVFSKTQKWARELMTNTTWCCDSAVLSLMIIDDTSSLPSLMELFLICIETHVIKHKSRIQLKRLWYFIAIKFKKNAFRKKLLVKQDILRFCFIIFIIKNVFVRRVPSLPDNWWLVLYEILFIPSVSGNYGNKTLDVFFYKKQ